MQKQSLQQNVADILATADVKINGSDPWDLHIHNDGFYERVLSQGTLGLGESYMDGWWDCEQIDEFAFRVIRADLYKKARFGWRTMMKMLLARVINFQTKGLAARNAQRHYDIGNNLYQVMLDKRMVYTCGYWKDAANLDQAQENKLDLVCRKIRLQPGQRVLDLGCGWGSFAKFAAERYGAEVVGVTVAREQVKLGKELCKGLPVELRLQDYREVNEKFDHVVAIGLTEHIGYQNHRTFMNVAARCLKDNGLFLLHTNGFPLSKTSPDPFIDKYIFPNCLIPSLKQLGAAMEHLFVVEDFHSFGPYYDLTLMAWFHNFDRHWDQLKEEYGERFYRMWKYYLLSNAGSFRARNNQLWQMVLSKKGVLGGYESVR
ncbi:cyclopropane fatty acyl phospholipid synthase [Pontibacter toksunensis]|uniref:Cyclopropane fatty acyl phospholipid synthase n=1 Tax=Pontibacter toksunensis TaxID=1332631 RepID=A0ABW6C1X5_9BACT